MRKPRICDAKGCNAPWPGHGIGCPTNWSDQPAGLRGVHLWHCNRPECEADYTARFAAQLRKHGRPDLADKLAPAPRPGAALPLPKSRPADPAQGALL